MEQLKPLIEELVKIIQSGSDVVSGQMPDIARQIVRLYLWGNVIEIPILIGFMVLGYYGLKWLNKKAEPKAEDRYGDAQFWRLGFIPIIIFEIFIGFYTYGCTQTLLKAILAPKVLIVEVLMGYMKAKV